AIGHEHDVRAVERVERRAPQRGTREHSLRCHGLAEALGDARREVAHRDATSCRAHDDLVVARCTRRVHRRDLDIVVERGRDEPWSFDHELAALLTLAMGAQQLPELADLRTACAEGAQAAASASRAVETSAPKVAGSRTAMSASTLRSTSTSAAFRPA